MNGNITINQIRTALDQAGVSPFSSNTQAVVEVVSALDGNPITPATIANGETLMDVRKYYIWGCAAFNTTPADVQRSW